MGPAEHPRQRKPRLVSLDSASLTGLRTLPLVFEPRLRRDRSNDAHGPQLAQDPVQQCSSWSLCQAARNDGPSDFAAQQQGHLHDRKPGNFSKDSRIVERLWPHRVPNTSSMAVISSGKRAGLRDARGDRCEPMEETKNGGRTVVPKQEAQAQCSRPAEVWLSDLRLPM